MGKLVKAILIFFSSLVVLIVAAAIIIPLVVDLNDYKAEMEAAVQKQTGRTMKIEGDLDLSVFPWLGVSTGKIVLSNAAGFTENSFAVIGEADIKVKLRPLFSKKIELRTVVLKGLELHLEKNRLGISNWSDMSAKKESVDQLTEKQVKEQVDTSQAQAPEKKSDTAGTAIGLADIKIGGLVIENSQVSWNDQQSGQHIVIKDFNLSSGAVVFNKPIAIKIAFLLENTAPAITEQLSLSTSLVIDETLQKIQLNNFQLDSVTKGESIPGGVIDTQLESEIILDLQEQTLALKKLQLVTNLMHLTGELNASKIKTDLQYTGALQIASFSPKKLMQQLAMSVPETADKQVLQKLAISFDLQGTIDSVALENLIITLDDTQINGYTRVQQFNQPAIAFQLAIDDIDVDRYSAPKQETKSGKTPPTVAKAPVAEATLLPMDTLRTLNIDGDLKIAKLKVAQLKMAGVNVNIQAKQGLVKSKHSISQLYQGRYQGQISINAKSKKPAISLNEKISSVQLEPLLNDLMPDSKAKLKGLANITTHLNTTGNTMTAIKSGLRGRLSFAIEKGAVRGFNLQEIIDIGRLAVKGKKMQQSYSNEQTLFSIIKGSAIVKRGVINNPDFLAESSTIEVKGGGTANLVNEALDYKVVAKIKKGGKDIANRPVAINVKGTFSKPTYNVDLTSIESMMTEEEKQKVDKLVNKHEKEIDKALGEGSGKAV
ncbi:MAG: hypothetical protein DRQ62_12050, partial [Gammaproteobacteria bacterium]